MEQNNLKGLTNHLHTIFTASKPQDQRNDKEVMAAPSYQQLYSLERNKASSDQSEFSIKSDMEQIFFLISLLSIRATSDRKRKRRSYFN